MRRIHRFGPWVQFCGLLALGWGTATECHAADADSDCSAVSDAAAAQEDAGHLRDAKALFQECAADSCANPTRAVCQAKLFRLELDVPSVVPLAKDATGAPLVDVQVTMDGVVLATRLDGRAFSVDPGLHEFAFSVEGRSLGAQQLVIAQGQRNRELWAVMSGPTVSAATAPPMAAEPIADKQPGSVAFAAKRAGAQDAKAAAEPLKRPNLQHVEAASVTHSELAPKLALSAEPAPSQVRVIAPYVLGGAALLGGGAYLMLSSWARSDNQKLSQCSPNCAPSSVAHIRSLYLAADISLAVAVAAALSSTALFVFGSGSHSDHGPAPAHGLALSVQPERAGALATLRGTL